MSIIRLFTKNTTFVYYRIAKQLINEKVRQKRVYHRGDIPAAGGGLFHSETGPALGIAGTCGEI